MFKPNFLRFILAASFALPVTVACGQGSGLEALPKHEQARRSALTAADLARDMSESQARMQERVEANDAEGAEDERERARLLEVEVRTETEYAKVLLEEAVSGGECDCSDQDRLEVLTEDGDETAHVILDGCDTYVHTKDGDEEVTVSITGSNAYLDGADCGEIAHYIDSAEDVADFNEIAVSACDDAVGDIEEDLEFCDEPASLFDGVPADAPGVADAIADLEATCADLGNLYGDCLDDVGAVTEAADEELEDIPEPAPEEEPADELDLSEIPQG